MKQVRLCLDKYLNERNISRYWLSKQANTQPIIVSNYYKNKVVKYDSALLSRICDALDCDISDIIECVDVETTE